MKTQTVDKLRDIIHTEVPSPHLQMLHKDAFALGCYLHLQGQKVAGRKMCSEVLAALGYDRRKAYFMDLLDGLQGNEVAYADGIWAHSEINELFNPHVHRAA
ncbi:hypothetical protein KIH07_02955 [Hydrogenophaga taeniospiralis]|uniref:hypothetical protein n=1 Tax=Hydrogenophaga taeniospiralis TaxID=65656 RepID=UPI001CFBB552|nr:hypothetical protein [Hydrogenophaga taeniospiralis]MCB4362676.1 hypothetical protein [Hydrogenophaga taeniospiralis]